MTVLTRWILHHKLIVGLFWLAVAVAGAASAAAAVHGMVNSFSLPGAGVATNNQINELYHNGGSTDPLIPVVTVPAGQSLADPATRATAARVLGAARISQAVRLVENSAFTGTDGKLEYGFAFVPADNSNGTALATPMLAALRAAAPPGWSAGLTGNSLVNATAPPRKGNGVLVASMLGGVGALVILAFVFASFLALLPLVIAAVSVLSTFLLVLGLDKITQVSQIVVFLIALIGLGVAIDYSLLVVTRWREERSRLGISGHGEVPRELNYRAIETAMAHAGRAVVFSGLTVAIGLLALAALPVSFLRSTGFAGMFVPLMSVLVAITLLPVILATIGHRLDWPRLRREGSASRAWAAWAALVFRFKWVAATGGAVLLALFIAPMFSMHVGSSDTAQNAGPSPARTSLLAMIADGAPAGVITPFEVLTSSGAAGPVAAAARRVPGVVTAFADAGEPPVRGTALVTAVPAADTGSPGGLATVAAIRAALDGKPGVIGVGGDGPELADFNHAVYGNFPLMLGLIGLATFILLARAFRSVLLALKAVLFNLASVGAAFGVMTFVWQEGHGSRLWGEPATGNITMWVPLMVFAFLFGLSMDYEVFILARAREAFDASSSTRTAVVTAIGRTGRLVTCAALILLMSFISMSTTPQVDVAVLATGLGAGIFIDATVVRCLMVPALVALFGRYNWWLPAGFARVLRVPASPLPAAGAGRHELAGVGSG